MTIAERTALKRQKNSAQGDHQGIWLTLFRTVWETEGVPKDWSKGIIVKLFKERRCPVLWKLERDSLLNRIINQIDQNFCKEQSGFRPRRACADLIFIMQNADKREQ